MPFLKASHLLIFWSLISVLAHDSNLHAASSITRAGVTWTFNQDLITGVYANGDPWVVEPSSGSGVTIITISPESDGLSNGTVVNVPRSRNQGFDSRMQRSPYRPEWNIATQLPYTVSANSSVMSAISLEQKSLKDDPQIKSYSILTVLASTPPIAAFRPGYINGNFSHPWAEEDLNYSKLAKMSINGFGGPDITTIKLTVPVNEQDLNWTGRYKHAVDASPAYGRDLARKFNTYLLLLNSDASNSDKRDLLIGMVQYGIDIHSIIETGGQWYADGGHNLGRIGPLLVAAMTLDDADMKANLSGGEMNFQEFQQTFYVSQTDIDSTKLGDPPDKVIQYEQNDLGMPEWGIRHHNKPSRDNNRWDARYRHIGGGLLQAPAIAAHLMGARNIIGHNAFFDYAKRHIYYREGRYKNPKYYNGYDDDDGYGEGNVLGDNTPLSDNETPSFHRNFYLAHEDTLPIGQLMIPVSPTGLYLKQP